MDEVQLLPGGIAATHGNGSALISLRQHWSPPGSMPSWLEFPGANDMQLRFKEVGIYIVSGCIVPRVVLPSRADARMVKVNTALFYSMDWGGVGG